MIEILSDLDDDDELCYLCREYFNDIVKYGYKYQIFILNHNKKIEEKYTTELIKETPIVKKEKTNIWM